MMISQRYNFLLPKKFQRFSMGLESGESTILVKWAVCPKLTIFVGFAEIFYFAEISI